MHKPVVLSIEDDPELFRLITYTLKGLPLSVLNAPNGREAVRMVKELAPDLILLDISLPDLHGWEVLRELREKDGIVVEKVIVLTTYTDPRHRVMGHFQDIIAYISKPFDPHKLAALVAETLGLPYADKPTR